MAKTPEECSDIQEIRMEIDRIDQDIIRLLGERYGYVKAAAKFKTNETSVKAPDRVAAMLQERRIWAGEASLSPDMIEKLYADLVNYFMQQEMEKWKKRHV